MKRDLSKEFQGGLMEIKGVRCKKDNKGMVWLNLEDVARGLGFVNKRDNKVRVDRVKCYLEVFGYDTTTFGGKVLEQLIPENIFYKLAFKANSETARKFQDKVCDEILPQIRISGGYVQEEREEDFINRYFPSFSDDVKKAMVLDLKKTNEEQKKQIEEMKPKALFAESVEGSEDSILVREMASIIKQSGINIGEKRLFVWLRDNCYLCKSGESYNLPTQKSKDLKIMEIKKTTRTNAKGVIKTNTTTKITGKGQIYLLNKIKKEQSNENE